MTFQAELEAALRAVDKGNNQEALHLFQQIDKESLQPYEQCVVLLNEKKCLELLGRFKEARGRLEAIQRVDQTGQFGAYLELGYIQLLFAEGKLHDAIERSRRFLLERAEELKQPEYEDVVYDLKFLIACHLVSAKQFSEAVTALLHFQPRAREEDRPRLHLFLGIAYEQLGQPEKAEREFKQILGNERVPELVTDAYYRLGAICFRRGAYAWAKDYFLAVEGRNHALPADLSLRDLYTFLANTCGYLGEEAERKKYLQLAKRN